MVYYQLCKSAFQAIYSIMYTSDPGVVLQSDVTRWTSTREEVQKSPQVHSKQKPAATTDGTVRTQLAIFNRLNLHQTHHPPDHQKHWFPHCLKASHHQLAKLQYPQLHPHQSRPTRHEISAVRTHDVTL